MDRRRTLDSQETKSRALKVMPENRGRMASRGSVLKGSIVMMMLRLKPNAAKAVTRWAGIRPHKVMLMSLSSP